MVVWKKNMAIIGSQAEIIQPHSFISKISDDDCFLSTYGSGLPFPFSGQCPYKVVDPSSCKQVIRARTLCDIRNSIMDPSKDIRQH